MDIENSHASVFKMANNNENRFFLNLDSNRPAFNDRAYPTTPSTFPNPIFPSQGQMAQQQQQSQNSQQQPYSTGFAPAGYFNNNQYPPSYPQQPPSTYQQGAPLQAPQQNYQPRASPVQPDATNGLAHQFSHQNLGGATRTYGNRQPTSSQRPRTAGAPQQQVGYASYLNAPMPSQAAQQKWPEFETAPERNSDRFGQSTHVNQKKTSQLAESFFKDSVRRARDRNVRSVISCECS